MLQTELETDQNGYALRQWIVHITFTHITTWHRPQLLFYANGFFLFLITWLCRHHLVQQQFIPSPQLTQNKMN